MQPTHSPKLRRPFPDDVGRVAPVQRLVQVEVASEHAQARRDVGHACLKEGMKASKIIMRVEMVGHQIMGVCW